MALSIQTILHPTDFSDNSRLAFQTACSLARDHGARLIVFHVKPALMRDPPWNPLVAAEAQEMQGMTFTWPQPSDPDLRVEHRVAEGEAAVEIIRLAQTLKCELIVMATHGRTGLARLLAGSVAEEVLRKAPCPVLAVRIPPPTPPAAPEATARPGDIVDVRALGAKLALTQTRTLLRASRVQVIRLIVPAGKEIETQKTKGETVVHCLEGCVAFTALGKTQNLEAGHLLYLPAGESHKVTGVKETSLLLTMFL